MKYSRCVGHQLAASLLKSGMLQVDRFAELMQVDETSQLAVSMIEQLQH
jgi:hypothetical protein